MTHGLARPSAIGGRVCVASCHSPARADFTTRGTEVAPILANHRIRSTRAAFAAEHGVQALHPAGLQQGGFVSARQAADGCRNPPARLSGFHLPTRQTRQHPRRHLIAFGIEKAATVQNLLDRKGERRHFGVMPARRAMTVETLHLAEPHLPAIP